MDWFSKGCKECRQGFLAGYQPPRRATLSLKACSSYIDVRCAVRSGKRFFMKRMSLMKARIERSSHKHSRGERTAAVKGLSGQPKRPSEENHIVTIPELQELLDSEGFVRAVYGLSRGHPAEAFCLSVEGEKRWAVY